LTFEQEKLGEIVAQDENDRKDFEEVYLKDNCDTRYGYTQSATDDKVGPKFLRITDIQEDIIDWDNVPYCEIENEDFDKFKLKHGDIVVARTGASTGSNSIYRGNMPESVFASYLIRVRSNEKFNQEFLYRFMQSEKYSNHIKSVLSGSAQPNANAKDITEVNVPCPSVTEQKKIANILQQFDKKIEVNKKISGDLEDMAQSIFKSWFADFEPFDEFKSSKIGEIPAEFTVSNLTDVVEIVLGGTPDSSEDSYWGGDIVWAKTKDISNEEGAFIFSTEESITQKGLEESSTEIAPENSTIITARGTVGKLAMPAFDMGINQSCYSLVPVRNTDNYFVYCLMNNILNNLTSRTHGTVFDTITKSTLKEQEIVLPPLEHREKFDHVVRSMMEKIKENKRENMSLRNIRDTLLPKLMSGEIRVNDIELDELRVNSEF